MSKVTVQSPGLLCKTVCAHDATMSASDSGQGPVPADGSRGGTTHIADVAAEAGVSTTTVSHVFSGRRPVAPDTRRRVTEAARRLGYQPSSIAQALRSGRSRTVALITQDLTNPFYPALARGLQQTLGAAEHALLLFDAGAHLPAGPSPVDVCLQRQVDGVVVAVDGLGTQLTTLGERVPLVGVGPEFLAGPGAGGMDVTMADDVAIGRDIGRYLAQRGHRTIAVVAGPAGLEPSSGRLAGFRGVLADLGLPVPDDHVVHGDWTMESGSSGLTTLLRLDPRPTAVFAANDLMALGVLREAARAGLTVPDDVAVVGVDDITAAALVDPALTTVHIPAIQIGRCAGELVLSRLDGTAGDEPRRTVVPHLLVTRQSA